MIIGHSHLITFFEKAIQNGSLSHTYCFAGPEGVGKRAVARHIAALLLKVDEAKLEQHPDFYYAARTANEKTGKLNKDFSVDQVRALRSHLGETSWSGGYQVAILDDAELLNESSGNALLKVLEEPPEKSVIFLLTDNDQKLLPTIRSRAQLFYLNLPSASELTAGLIAAGYQKLAVQEAVMAAGFRPGRAIALLRDRETLAAHLAEVERCRSLVGEPLYTKFKLVDNAFGDKEDAERGRERLQEILDIWINCWREALLQKNQINAGRAWPEGKLAALTGNEMARIIDSFMETKVLLKRNIHPRLLIERAIIPL
ncbi:MAG: hypothetical protein HY983_03610 [Candidatus Magasanikbacteria bacterium]|nr:hypothetical protein [Candidatus Magasanikbacteria bacterium]